MRAGKLDRRITLLARSLARETNGEAIEGYEEVGEVWAQVIHDRSGEKRRAMDVQVQAQQVVTFRIRWREGLNRQMRVRWEGADYDVTDVMEIGRRVGADLQAVASVE